jgi:hypothetical protein
MTGVCRSVLERGSRAKDRISKQTSSRGTEGERGKPHSEACLQMLDRDYRKADFFVERVRSAA